MEQKLDVSGMKASNTYSISCCLIVSSIQTVLYQFSLVDKHCVSTAVVDAELILDRTRSMHC